MQIKLKIAGASASQLLTLRMEINNMSRQWRRFGCQILVDGKEPEISSGKLQATSLNRINKKSVTNFRRW
tara:strand:- start:672 stop:881 length:210 start_codon:yes stop_codon:yes gene_type:complete